MLSPLIPGNRPGALGCNELGAKGAARVQPGSAEHFVRGNRVQKIETVKQYNLSQHKASSITPF